MKLHFTSNLGMHDVPTGNAWWTHGANEPSPATPSLAEDLKTSNYVLVVFYDNVRV